MKKKWELRIIISTQPALRSKLDVKFDFDSGIYLLLLEYYSGVFKSLIK